MCHAGEGGTGGEEMQSRMEEKREGGREGKYLASECSGGNGVNKGGG